jgi:Flp pilus assembly protein TadG
VSTGEGSCEARATREVGDGSITVELLALTPVLLVFVTLGLALGRYEGAIQQVRGEAEAGAEAAATAPSAQQARQAAVDAARLTLPGQSPCTGSSVAVTESDFVQGGVVSVTVTCHISFSDLAAPGIPGGAVVHATQSAPVDPYRAGS